MLRDAGIHGLVLIDVYGSVGVINIQGALTCRLWCSLFLSCDSVLCLAPVISSCVWLYVRYGCCFCSWRPQAGKRGGLKRALTEFLLWNGLENALTQIQ